MVETEKGWGMRRCFYVIEIHVVGRGAGIGEASVGGSSVGGQHGRCRETVDFYAHEGEGSPACKCPWTASIKDPLATKCKKTWNSGYGRK